MNPTSLMTVENLIEALNSSDQPGQTKTAFAHQEVQSAAEQELLGRVTREMGNDEILKQAAAARLSGQIIAEMTLEKVASGLAPVIQQAVHVKIAELLPKVAAEVIAAAVPPIVAQVLQKVAVGTSSSISGNLTHSTVNDGPANKLQREEDNIGRGSGGKVDRFFHTDETVGASVSGGSHPEGGAGDNPAGFPSVHKLSAAKTAAQKYLIDAERKKDEYLAKVANDQSSSVEDYRQAKVIAAQYIEDAEKQASYFVKRAELEADLARYQELEKKAEAGALTPDEQSEMDMLQQKLMAAAGQAGGGAPPPGAGAPPAGGPPPGGMAGGAPGGAPGGSMGSFGAHGATEGEQKEAAVKALLAKYNLGR